MSEFKGFDVNGYMAEMQAAIAEAAQVQTDLADHAIKVQSRITKSTDAHQQFAHKWNHKIQAQAANVAEYDGVFDVSSSKIIF